ncbi:Rv3654c family TadE-like protein [Arthrobacter sp.]|uniref:Rv3654c family TadE-like protein n=1 Tax=Arthrobacter sp. TaxID=1667 RepID=UPI003395FF73
MASKRPPSRVAPRRSGPSAPSRHVQDRGAGTVLAAGLVLLLCLMLTAVASVLQAGTASARAGKAADLAALAGADAARGLLAGDPCSLAAEVAGKQGAELSACSRSGPGGVVVDVRSRTALPDVFGWLNGEWTHAEGRARAGPPPGDGRSTAGRQQP